MMDVDREAAANRDILRIGDVISLRIGKNDGWLCADAILDQIFSCKNPEYIEDVLWEVHVQNQYNCSKDYKETLEISGGKDASTVSTSLLEQLKNAEANERKLNSKLMTMKIGKPVAFGDIVQLRHMKSRKMLTVLDTVLAKTERENMRIVLNKEGDSLSWLELVPRHKYDHEGQLITDEAELYMRVRERPGEYIHSAKKMLAHERNREINSSLDNTCWTVIIYQHTPQKNSREVLAGHLVSLQEIELSAYVTLDSCSPGITQEAYVVVSPVTQLSNVAADCNIGTGMLWMLEKKDFFSGGRIDGHSGKLSLRHFNSGLFMKVDNGNILVMPERAEATYFDFNIQQGSEVSRSSVALQEGFSIQLSHQGQWLAMHRTGADRRCFLTKDKSQALFLVVSNKTFRLFEREMYTSLECCRRLRIFEELVDDNSWQGLYPAEHMLKNIFSVLQVIVAFLTSTSDISDDAISDKKLSASVLTITEDNQVIRQTIVREHGILSALMDLLQSSENNAFAELAAAVPVSGSPVRLLSQRFSTLNADKLFDGTNGVSRTPLSSSHSLKKLSRSEKVPPPLQGGNTNASDDICHEILDCLFHCISKNHENKMFIADRFPILLKQIKTQQSAVLCVKEMLHNNLQLLQTKVREREMAIFLDLVITTEMNPTLLSLLQGTCSCPMGVDSTQRMIVLALYNNIMPICAPTEGSDNEYDDFQVNDDRSLVIDIVVDSTICRATNWGDGGIYMQSLSSGGSPSEVLGHELVEHGLPRLLLTWEQDIRRDDYSVENLFGYPQRVPLEVVCNVFEGSVSSYGRRNSTSLRKRRRSMDNKRPEAARTRNATAGLDDSISRTGARRAALGGYSSSFFSPPSIAVAPADGFSCDNLGSRNERAIHRPLPSSAYPKKVITLQDGKTEDLRSGKLGNGVWGNFRRRFGGNGISSASHVENGGEKYLATSNVVSVNQSRRGSVSNRIRRQSSFNQLQAVQRIKKKAENKKMKSLEDMRLQFIEYFIAQLYLGADLCLDRNYVAIGILEKRLPYSVLLTMLKTEYIPNRIKAPVCRILKCLHIDREPQVPVRFPRLIRTSVSLSGGDESSTVNSTSFALIQQIISDYIHERLDTTQCDELSTEMISLLESLMIFGFYGTSTQLQDVINPLVQVLDDHRNIGIITAAAANTKSKSTRKMSIDKGATNAPKTEPALMQLDEEYPLSALTASVKRFQELGLGELQTQWFFERWYEAALDYIEDSYLYDLFADYFIGETENSVTASLFSSDQDVESMWEHQVLQLLESVQMLYLILAVVIVVCVLALLRVFGSVEESYAYIIFDVVVSAVFITELTLRMFCFLRVHRNILNFFRSIFNLIDFVIVVFDVIMISMNASTGVERLQTFAKTLRIVRIVRIFRIVRAAKILSKIAEKTGGANEWIFPARYLSITEHEAKTIAGILRVLSVINLRIQDRQLGTVIKAFVKWYDGDISGARRDPVDVYNEVIGQKVDGAAAEAYLPQKLDEVLLDIIMYSDPNLVEEALRMLMVHKSQEILLLSATAKIQIISTPKIEAKYRELSLLLLKLNRAAEAFEVWGGLKTDLDIKEAENILIYLKSIINVTRVSSNPQVLDPQPLYVPDQEVQQLLLNLDAMSTIIQFQYALCDGTLEIPHPDICNLLKKSNEIICWFVAGNEDNQCTAFKSMDWFVRTLPLGVNSSKAIRAIVWENKALAKECPRKYISDCLNHLATEQKNPDYLDLLVGITHIPDVGDSGILSIRNEVALHLSHIESRPDLDWCSAPGTPGYLDRRNAMALYLTKSPTPEDEDLSPEIQYHINYLMLLSGCKLGPKLQAMYQIDHVVAAIIDEGTIFNVRVALGKLLLEMVATGMNNLSASEGMWLFVKDCCVLFESSKSEMQLLFRRYDRVPLRVQKSVWLDIVLNILLCFFSEFTLESFNDAISYGQDLGSNNTTQSENELKQLIRRLAVSIKDLMSANAKFVGLYFSELMKNVISVLSVSLDHEIFFEDNPDEENGQRQIMTRKNIPIRRNSVADEIQQVFYKKQFSFFVDALMKSQKSLHRAAVDMFERMPSVHDRVHSDIRCEPFITKVTSHIRSRIQRFTTSCILDKSSMESTLWILQTLRLVIEKHLGYDVHHIAEPSTYLISDNPCVVALQNMYNDCGVTDLCLDLLAVGIDQSLCIQAAMLLVAMLHRSGGNMNCQKKIFSYLNKTDSTLFFEELKEMIDQQILWCQRHAESKDDLENDMLYSFEMPEQVLVLKMISLLCEGNYLPCKNILREQDGNARFANILGTLVEYMKLLSRSETPNCTLVAIRVVKTIVALLSGPCLGNQEYFVLHGDMLAALNRLLRASAPITASEQWLENILLLKEYIVDVLRACVEARSPSSAIFERVESVIESNVLNVLIFPGDASDDKKDLSNLQANYLVFLQTLAPEATDRPPHVKSKIANNIASVEVIWNNSVHRHYFHIPSIAAGISEKSKKELLNEIEFSNQEGRLKDFLRRSRKLYTEAVHYQVLAGYGLHHAWVVKDKLTWFMLMNAIVMNALLVRYYYGDKVPRVGQSNKAHSIFPETNSSEFEYVYDQLDVVFPLSTGHSDEEPKLSNIWIDDTPRLALYFLNIIHIIAAGVVFALVVLLRSPVIYQCNLEVGIGRIRSLLKVLTDPLPVWYCVHFTLALIAILYSDFILSALLLEFVAIDSTTKDVLFTVINPARQLAVTVVIILIITQVFSCVVFLYYRDQFVFLDCFSMWDSFKIGVSYGARAEEGIGKYMIASVDDRMVMDVVFFFIIPIILKNCFVGVIIDTFGTLRNKKMERETDQNEICFICGLDKHEVDKRTSRNRESGFSHHRQIVHNIWNYLFFAMRIWNQPREEDMGVELHVRNCIEAGDISWLPIGITGVVATTVHPEGHISTSRAVDTLKSHNLDHDEDQHDNLDGVAINEKEIEKGSHDDRKRHSSLHIVNSKDKKKRNSSMYRRLSMINQQLAKIADERPSLLHAEGNSRVESFMTVPSKNEESATGTPTVEKQKIMKNLMDLDSDFIEIHRRLSLLQSRSVNTPNSAQSFFSYEGPPVLTLRGMNSRSRMQTSFDSINEASVEEEPTPESIAQPTGPTDGTPMSARSLHREGSGRSIKFSRPEPSYSPNAAAQATSAKVLRDLYYENRTNTSSMMSVSGRFSSKRSLKGPSLKQVEKMLDHKKDDEKKDNDGKSEKK